MGGLLKGCLYSALLAAIFFLYFVKVAVVETVYASGLAVLSFGIFLMLNSIREWKSEKKRKALSMIGVIVLFSLLIAPVSVPLAINTFVTFTAGSLALIYREELLPGMPAFMYTWLGAAVGFVVALITFSHTNMGDAIRALGLIGLMLIFAGIFLLVGRKVHYRPFNRYPV
ncbi:hypothetical protein [Thermococcus sp.]